MHGSAMPMGMYGMGMGHSMFQPIGTNFSPITDMGKGKGKLQDADFEAAFAQFASMNPQSETGRITEVDATTEDLEAALEQTKLDDGEEITDFKT